MEEEFYKFVDSTTELNVENVTDFVTTHGSTTSFMHIIRYMLGFKLRGRYDSYKKLQLLVILYNQAQAIYNIQTVLLNVMPMHALSVHGVEYTLSSEIFKLNKRIVSSAKYKNVPCKLHLSMVQREE